jgi:hypothetical protein
MAYVYRESPEHLLAKEKLADWLKECDAGAPSIDPFYWKRGSFGGVRVELEFFEESSPYYFELSANVLDHTADLGKRLFVPDICVFQNGVPKIFVEVVWSSRVAKYKKARISEFFKGYLVEVWEVKADYILGLAEYPARLPAKLVLTT